MSDFNKGLSPIYSQNFQEKANFKLLNQQFHD
ncbi:Protein of unknown function [Lactobacillus equicursoris 66c]|uniref:Uncharacterized protein n=1 Tax=Lactobacillus equicursoris 66c TaxID=872326 RepID=K0NQJ6_9LACO|nr:Protein of unknown function [Lactobacillus equicursoris 66c]